MDLKTHINFVKCSSCTICKKEPIEEFEVQKLNYLGNVFEKSDNSY